MLCNYLTSNARLGTRSALSRRNTISSHNELLIYSVSKNDRSFDDVISHIRIFQSQKSKREFFMENHSFRQTSNFPY